MKFLLLLLGLTQIGFSQTQASIFIKDDLTSSVIEIKEINLKEDLSQFIDSLNVPDLSGDKTIVHKKFVLSNKLLHIDCKKIINLNTAPTSKCRFEVMAQKSGQDFITMIYKTRNRGISILKARKMYADELNEVFSKVPSHLMKFDLGEKKSFLIEIYPTQVIIAFREIN